MTVLTVLTMLMAVLVIVLLLVTISAQANLMESRELQKDVEEIFKEADQTAQKLLMSSQKMCRDLTAHRITNSKSQPTPIPDGQPSPELGQRLDVLR